MAKVYEVFIEGRYVDSLESTSLSKAKLQAAVRFNRKVVVKERKRNG